LIKLFVYEYLTGGGIDPGFAQQSSLADLSALIVEGRVMRDALVADLAELDGIQVTFASSRFEHISPARASCKAQPGESLTDFVGRMARASDYSWVIAPESDGLLLDLHDVVPAPRWLGCAREAIVLASSKRETAAHLATHGVDVTPSLTPRTAVQHDGARWVVKPDDGAGGLETFLFDRLDAACAEYESRIAAGRRPVLQEWIDGEPLSLSLICDEYGAQLISINRQCIGLSDGEATRHDARVVEFDGVVLDQIDRYGEQGRALDKVARRVATAMPGLRGFVGIDVVWHPRRGPVVIEVNPRLTVAYAGLSSRLGRNLAEGLLQAHGVAVPAGPFSSRRGETMARPRPGGASW
jgi:tyramine---L-glutamate ligase